MSMRAILALSLGIGLGAFMAVLAGEDRATEPGLRYVVPEAGEPFEHSPLMAISLSDEKPSDLIEQVRFRGTARRYGQLRFGTLNSVRVTVVVDQRANREFDLYVDANRNFQMEPKELIAGDGAVRRMKLGAEIRSEDEAEHRPRTVLFRRGVTGGSIGFATVGYLAGEATIGGRTCAVRRVDGDGNGLFTDARDRLWLDRDGNSEWDPFTEQLPLLPVMKFDDVRYAVKSDVVGTSLRFEPIIGEGKIRLRCQPSGPDSQVSDLFVMLVGSDGSALSLRCGDEAVAVPVGHYAVQSVTLAVRTGADGMPWNFGFARHGTPAEKNWHRVEKDATVTIDPVGKLTFAVVANDGKPTLTGKDVRIQPQLTTQDGLVINSCTLGAHQERWSANESQAQVKLVSLAGEVLHQAQSGFA